MLTITTPTELCRILNSLFTSNGPWCFAGRLNRQDTHGSCDTTRRFNRTSAFPMMVWHHRLESFVVDAADAAKEPHQLRADRGERAILNGFHRPSVVLAFLRAVSCHVLLTARPAFTLVNGNGRFWAHS